MECFVKNKIFKSNEIAQKLIVIDHLWEEY